MHTSDGVWKKLEKSRKNKQSRLLIQRKQQVHFPIAVAGTESHQIARAVSVKSIFLRKLVKVRILIFVILAYGWSHCVFCDSVFVTFGMEVKIKSLAPDFARAITFLHQNSSTLGIDMNGYSLWGGSAGARMAAWLGSLGTEYFGEQS